MDNRVVTNIIAERPKAYEWFGFQQFFMIVFLITGIGFLINTLYTLIGGAAKMIIIEAISNELTKGTGVKPEEVQKVLMTLVGSLELEILIFSLLLSATFFMLARYCKKTINRNRYILKLEQVLKNQNAPTGM